MAEKIKISDLPLFDVAEYLDSDEMIAAYLTVSLEDDDPAELARALGTVARARGMTQLARDTGLAREALYRSLSATGNPSFATVNKVMRALGLKLVPQPVSAH
ncbi:MAG: putative addiction module antidote protein [Betaproteobacteria bacterium]|nr:putative addiction module antidote protein [Betaproteobacteria bacterium]MCL2885301.1 putative addiction module antidote protein [Betaproteobacteria bacterium]